MVVLLTFWLTLALLTATVIAAVPLAGVPPAGGAEKETVGAAVSPVPTEVTLPAVTPRMEEPLAVVPLLPGELKVTVGAEV